MKTALTTTMIAITLFIVNLKTSTAQTHSCCAMSSTQEFAMLGTKSDFAAAHLAPIPFSYSSDKGKMVAITCKDGKPANAYEVRTAKASNKYLVVIHEWWGLNDYIKREAVALFEELGDVNVIAIDLYDGKVADAPDKAQECMKSLTDDRAKAIINGVVEYAGKNAKIQSIGWCMGGGWSLQTSLLAGKQMKGCVMYYGMPEKSVDKLKTIACPVLGIFANKDKYITPEVVAQFEKDMKAAGKTLTVKRYDADHAFANPSNPHYEKTMADEAHGIAVKFLNANFK